MGQCQGNRQGVLESQGRREKKGCTRASFKEMSMASQKKMRGAKGLVLKGWARLIKESRTKMNKKKCRRASIEEKKKTSQRVKGQRERKQSAYGQALRGSIRKGR